MATRNDDQKAHRRAYEQAITRDPILREKRNKRQRELYAERAATSVGRKRHNTRQKDKRTLRREMTDVIKVGQGCADCGYNADPIALDFDHLPGTDKIAAVATMVGDAKGWEMIIAEIAKCEVVCSNCHRIRTRDRRNRGS